jgi:hypothetical protein
VSGHGVVRGKGRAGTASFRVTASRVVYRSRTQRFGSLSVTSIRFGEHSALLRGVGRANGRRVRFAVVVVDRGATGDLFRIAWGGGSSRGGTVVRGGVTVR